MNNRWPKSLSSFSFLKKDVATCIWTIKTDLYITDKKMQKKWYMSFSAYMSFVEVYGTFWKMPFIIMLTCFV